MKKLGRSLALLLAISGVNLIISSPAIGAVSARDFNAGRIIDDAVFYNKNAMGSLQEVQNFLNMRVPPCDTWGTGPSGYGSLTRAEYAKQMGWAAPPYACLQNYYENPATGETSFEKGGGAFAGGQSAAQIIWDASQEYGINPQVLLVMLRKESAGPLTADNWPLKSQYKYAMGYGCPDSGPNYSANCAAAKSGFYNQIRLAAWQLRYYANNIDTYNYRPNRNNYIQYNPDPNCGGRNVYIENVATASLYIYTPYVPNDAALSAYPGTAPCGAYGNRNFFMMFNDWFGSTSVPISIVKKASSPNFYLVDGNIKYLIPTWEILQAYGFERYTAITLGDSYIDGLANGNSLTPLSRSSSGVVYLNAKGKRYSVSGESCVNWGLDCYNPYALNTLNNDVLALTPNSGELQPLMENNGTVYKMVAGKKQPFQSYDSITERGYDWSKITAVESVNALQTMDILLPNSTSAMKFAASPIVYIYSDGQYFTVPNYESFVDWRVDKFYTESKPASSYETTPPPTIGKLPSIAKLNSEIFAISNGKKLNITGVSSDWPDASAQQGLSSLLSKLPLRNLSTQTTFRSEAGEIFTISNKSRRTIQSVNDFYKLGYTPELQVDLSSQVINLLNEGPGLLPINTLFKRADNNERIFVTNGNKSSILVPTFEIFTRYGFTQDVRTINTLTATEYTESGGLKSYLDKTAVSKTVLSSKDSVLYNLDTSTTALWGVPKSPVSLSAPPSQSVKNGSRFARNSLGSIYYADNGCKRLITTYDKFAALGGNNDNVMHVFGDFLTDVCTGPNI